MQIKAIADAHTSYEVIFMAVAHRGAISFGLVYIPVALYTATQDNDIHFNQLHKQDNSRIRYKKVCAHCGKEVGPQDIIKGFEYDKDKYVTMTDEDFEKAKTAKDRAINILHFTDLQSIKPVYYEKTYHVIPEAGGDKAFELLRRAMRETNKVAIAKAVLHNQEKLLALLPTDDGIYLETMFFADEIKEIPKQPPNIEVRQDELEMAKTLISTMDKPFEPELYHDEYQSRLMEIIESKIAGREVVSTEPEAQSNVIDLMEALKASIEQNKPQPKKRKARGA